MSNAASSSETSASSSAFPENWTMPPKPKVALDSGLVRMFGFQIHPRQVFAIAERLGIDTSSGYNGCADKVYARLMEEVPPEWRHMNFGTWRNKNGHKILTRVLYYNTNADEEEMNRFPSEESMMLVHRLICATEGPRWYRNAGRI